MCGIYCHLGNEDGASRQETLHEIACRGPDELGVIDFEWNGQPSILAASVLHLRGQHTSQPISSYRLLMAFNGEIYRYDLQDLGQDNDTSYLFDKLSQFETDFEAHLISVVPRMNGPFALVVIDRIKGVIYLAQSIYGRRSLVISRTSGLTVSSVAPRQSTTSLDCHEIPPGVHRLERNYVLTPLWTPQVPWINESKELNIKVDHVGHFIEHLSHSVKDRVLHVLDGRIAILFSGGVDCLLLARLAHEILPHDQVIELVNVCFEPNGPDRVNGIESYRELVQLCPRPWQFVEINPDSKQVHAELQRVKALILPNTSTMDLSLGLPLFFASKGTGQLHETQTPHQVRSKVYLSGLGADELLGGYARHLTAYKRDASMIHLLSELQHDLDNIHSRNLGRDDRMISCHGREARYPYLSAPFVEFVASLPLLSKMDLSKAGAGGDKAILRQACLRLGFSQAISFRPKKAMQFGSRSAFLTINGVGKQRKTKGSDTMI